jgi:endonuclease YncB( thermonuclease family)
MARPPRNFWPRPSPKPARFRRRSRWTRPRAYGVKPARFRRAPKSWRQAWAETRPFILGIFLLTAIAIHQMPGFYEPPGFLQSDPETVAGQFTRCGPGRGEMCVIDGDTFKIGDAKYRVTGIDTAEVDAACPAEAAQAEASTAALQGWLNRGAFQITTRLDEPTDRYGRTLAIVKRVRADGSEDRLADWMTDHGGARGYDGGFRAGWC